MNTPERKVFFYWRVYAILWGVPLFVIGAAFIAIFAYELLLLSPSDRQPPNGWWYVWLILGVLSTLGGLWRISIVPDQRPVLVLDSEGLFYRPHGNAIVPWRDILAVEFDPKDEGNNRLILTRQSGPPVSIDLFELWPIDRSGGKRAAHRAILEAWEAACARGAGPAVAGCETNTSERKKSLPPANARMRGMAMNAPERQEFFPPRISKIFGGGLLFLGGLPCVLAPSLLLLGFRDFPFAALLEKLLSPDSTENSVLMILTGLVGMFGGFAGLWMGFDRRPKLVVDNEGVFYQPHGEAIIPWRDIRAVEFDTRKRGDDPRLFLIRHSGVPVQIQDLGTSAYRAIAQAWERHGRKA